LSLYRNTFIDIYKKEITRAGSDDLLNWLDKTDFFTAPASTRFHGAFPEGLVIHSLNVYDILSTREFSDKHEENPESVAICALLHDLCKAEFYVESTRNIKNQQTGKWESVPYYTIDDKYPFGHGEKSVYLIERFFKLKPAEAIAIRWHMGGFDDNSRVGGYNVANAFEKYPLATKLHLADLEATYLLESTK